MCGAGYTGRVIYSSGQPFGCTPCPSSSWSIAGNGNTCFLIPCTTSSNYTGSAGYCKCNAGYYGSVKYVSGSLSGCVACGSSNLWSIAGDGNVCFGVSCSNKVGYTGPAGNCVCAAGFNGTVTYSSGSLFGCSACAINKWSDAGSNQPCLNIPCSKAPGYEGEDGFCVCSAGYYEASPVTYSSGSPAGGCVKCPQGTLSSSSSSKSCSLCPEGKYSSILGATACLDCMPGYYGNNKGSAACLICERGKYSDSASSLTCSLCPSGKYSDAIGASNSNTCVDCIAGMHIYKAYKDDCVP
jgi:hypothetical protein